MSRWSISQNKFCDLKIVDVATCEKIAADFGSALRISLANTFVHARTECSCGRFIFLSTAGQWCYLRIRNK